MIKVDKINWLSEEAKEAEVWLLDRNFNIICFSHPFNQVIGKGLSFEASVVDMKTGEFTF